LKAFADVQITAKLSVDLDLVAAAGVFARGNENNSSEPDGTYYLGAGTTEPYGIVNLGAALSAGEMGAAVGAKSTTCSTSTTPAPNSDRLDSRAPATTSPDRFRRSGEFPVQQATFYAPGAPATYWIGTRVKF
jgi:hypothetical protein